MALSPWHVASRLKLEEVANLMMKVGHPRGLDEPGIDIHEEWRRVIIEAAQRGEIEPRNVEKLVYDRDERGFVWRPASPSDHDCWEGINMWHVEMTFAREEVHRWLRSRGAEDEDIPDPLRMMPKPQATAEQRNKAVHPRRRHTYLTLIEALALEAMGGEIPAEPYKAAAVLQTFLERHGLKLDKDPIANTVKEIYTAREERASDPF